MGWNLNFERPVGVDEAMRHFVSRVPIGRFAGSNVPSS
jgi:hypothetical protein